MTYTLFDDTSSAAKIRQHLMYCERAC